jgi:hypothetical protein
MHLAEVQLLFGRFDMPEHNNSRFRKGRTYKAKRGVYFRACDRKACRKLVITIFVFVLVCLTLTLQFYMWHTINDTLVSGTSTLQTRLKFVSLVKQEMSIKAVLHALNSFFVSEPPVGIRRPIPVNLYMNSVCSGEPLFEICRYTRGLKNGTSDEAWLRSLYVPPGAVVTAYGKELNHWVGAPPFDTPYLFRIVSETGGCYNIAGRVVSELSVNYDKLRNRTIKEAELIEGCTNKEPISCKRVDMDDEPTHVHTTWGSVNQCNWFDLDYSLFQVALLEEDVAFPNRYRQLFLNKSMPIPELDAVADLRPDGKQGPCPPEKNRLAFPDKRDSSIVRMFRAPNSDVAIWFEHMQKAAGTSFCKWARRNMKHTTIPPCLCMIDGKGRLKMFSPKQLTDLLKGGYHGYEKCAPVSQDGKPYRILSNEWDQFPLERLHDKVIDGGPLLVFGTVLRDPLDRILSHYNYFFIENSKEGIRNPLEKARHLRGEMKNYYTRKLTNRQIHPLPIFDMEGDMWVGFEHYKLATEILQRFEFVVILEYLDYAKSAFKYIGWTFTTDRTNAAPHKLTTRSSHAVEEMSQDLLRALIADNYYDIRLYDFAVRLFVERNNGCSS